MKKVAKKVLVVLTLVMLGFVAGKVTQPEVVQAVEKEAVEIIEIVTKTGNYTNGYWNIEEGEYGIDFSDGSWALVNEEKEEYIFTPYCMGDWEIKYNSLDELERAIQNYIYLANN